MSKTAMKLALEALEEAWYHVGTFQPTEKAIDLYDEARTALREALANEALDKMAENARELGLDYEPAPVAKPHEQKPVAITITGKLGNIYSFTGDYSLKKGDKVYTTPPAQRTWVGLTDEEITDIWAESSPYYHEDDFARAIEAKLKEKNNG